MAVSRSTGKKKKEMLSWVRENFLFFFYEKNKNALFPSGPDLNCLLDLSTDWRVSIRLHSQSMT